jgi:MFS-type transporter involved in bile tolerance (Atg22 family)
MLYTLSALVVVAAALVAGRRADAQVRRRMWIGSLGVIGVGLLALVGALIGPWVLVYVSATMLLVGLPVAVVSSGWVYLDMRNESAQLLPPSGRDRT